MPTPTPIISPPPPPPAHPHPSLSLPRCDCKDVRVSSANCKRAVCKLQACRLQIARVSFAICKGAVFQTISVSKSKSFLFSFLFYFLCKLQGFLCKLQACPLQIAIVPCFLLKHSPPFPHASPIQELPRAGRGGQGLAVAAEGWQSCQGLLRAGSGCQGWQGLQRAGRGFQGLSAVFPTMTGILTSRSRPCAFQPQSEHEKNETALRPRREESQTSISV